MHRARTHEIIAAAAERRSQIVGAAHVSAEIYLDEFPGDAYDEEWATTAYEIDSQGHDWPDGSYELYSQALRRRLDEIT